MSFYMQLGAHDDFNAIEVERQSDGSVMVTVYEAGFHQETAIIPSDRVDEFVAGVQQEVRL